MISCADFIAELGNYLEGDLAALLRAQLEAHLSHCSMCQVIYDSSRKTLKIITDTECFDLPDEAFRPISDRIMARIREQAQ